MTETKKIPWFTAALLCLLIYLGMVATASANHNDTTHDSLTTFSFVHADVSVDTTSDEALKEFKDYRDFNHCFDNYRGWDAPERVAYDLLELLCGYIELAGVEYEHLSDVRSHIYNLVDNSIHHYIAKGLHPSGDALDFRFRVPSGVDEVLFYREHAVGLWYYILASGYYQEGIGLYDGLFFHVDTGRGVKANRRWAVINGQEVSFGRGIDEIIARARQRY